MKKIIILLFVIGIGLNLSAQKNINLTELNIDQMNLYKYKAVKMRKTGIGLTVAGSALAVTGFMLLRNYFWKTFDDPNYDRGPENLYGFTMLTGIVVTGFGVPLWIVGGQRIKKAEIALKKFDIKNPVSCSAIGLGVTIRF